MYLSCTESLHITTLKPEMSATRTLLADHLWALSSLAGLGHEANKFTIDSYITKWWVRTGKELWLLPLKSQAPKTKWYNSCTSVQNDYHLAASPSPCVYWCEQIGAKNARHGWIRTRKQRNFWMQVYNPRTDYHFAPVSIFRTAHK